MTIEEKYFIYVMSGQDDTIIKIGITNNLKARQTTLNVGRNHDPLRVVSAFYSSKNTCQLVESKIKHQWSNRIAAGEMYRATPVEAMEFLSRYPELSKFTDHRQEINLEGEDNDKVSTLVKEYRAILSEARSIDERKDEIVNQIRSVIGDCDGVYYCDDGKISLTTPIDEPKETIDESFFKEHCGQEYYSNIRFEPRNFAQRILIR
jgi:hypothetical protein